MHLTSLVFASGAKIPKQYTCVGAGMSPPLRWGDLPEGTASLALVVDDPDAPRGTFTHWLLANIPPDQDDVPQELDAAQFFRGGSLTPVEGANDFGETGYGPPCPPPGHGPHRYSFRLYALDAVLDLASGFSKADLEAAMQGHVLAEAELVGTFERAK